MILQPFCLASEANSRLEKENAIAYIRVVTKSMNDDGLPLHFTVNKTIVDQDTQIPQPPHFVIDLYPWQKAAVERMRHTEEGKYKYDENEYAEYDCAGLTSQCMVTNSVKHCGGLLNDAMGAVSRNVCCCSTVFDWLIC